MTRKTLGLIAGLIIALAVGFAGGSIWMHGKMAKAWAQSTLVNTWVNPMISLTYSSATGRVLSPEETATRLRIWLEQASAPVAYMYDNLPRKKKELVMSYTKGARNIAATQTAEHHSMHNLSILVGCLDSTPSASTSVRRCYEHQQHERASATAAQKSTRFDPASHATVQETQKGDSSTTRRASPLR